ncbi:helicase associated domain-containing protein [Streptomyces lasalocidi]
MWDELVFDRITFLSGDRTRRPCTPARPLRADELVGLLNPRHTPAPNQIWDTAHQHARAFYDTHGHLDVPSRHQTPDGFYLGWWVGRQRSLKTHGMLLPQRRAALDLLGIQWEHPPTSIELSSTSHATTPSRHGHLVPACAASHHGVRLGAWLSRRRAEADRHDLPYCCHRARTEIYPWWNSPWDKTGQWRRTYAAVLTAARQNKVPFPDLGPEQADNPYSEWLADQTAALPRLTTIQHELLGQIPLRRPLAYLLQQAPRILGLGLPQRTARGLPVLAHPPAPRRPRHLPRRRRRRSAPSAPVAVRTAPQRHAAHHGADQRRPAADGPSRLSACSPVKAARVRQCGPPLARVQSRAAHSSQMSHTPGTGLRAQTTHVQWSQYAQMSAQSPKSPMCPGCLSLPVLRDGHALADAVPPVTSRVGHAPALAQQFTLRRTFVE